MANGFFLGGMAEGIAGAQKQRLAEDTLTQDTSLRSRAVAVSESAEKRAGANDLTTRVDKQISDTMATAAEIIKGGIAGGKDPQAILKVVNPIVDTAKALAVRVGRNPASLDALVQGQLFQPTAVETAKVEGTAAGVKDAAKESALTAAGYDGLGKWKTLDEKVKAEGALRDDFLKQAQPFITVRDAKNRMDTIETEDGKATGAGDMSLVFTFMKVLDPGSTVREGEYATASNAAGVPEGVRAMINKVIGGGTLSQTAREQIKAQSEKIYKAAGAQHDKLGTTFAGIAQRNRLDVRSAVPDLLPAEAAPAARGSGVNIPAPPPGSVLVPSSR